MAPSSSLTASWYWLPSRFSKPEPLILTIRPAGTVGDPTIWSVPWPIPGRGASVWAEATGRTESDDGATVKPAAPTATAVAQAMIRRRRSPAPRSRGVWVMCVLSLAW
ncbi:hypothetical protein CXF32_07250 [Corynebacterium bovis]|nr:hypothetical protein CXF32_07250 [Corynebacterium bovis]